MLEPAILGPAAEALVIHASLESGDRVVDIGCGTGAASLCAARIVGPSGRVVGVDVNRGMIDVARARPDGETPASFDAGLSAQTLQFVPDRQQAVSEMRRVLCPGGRAGVSVWCALDRSPYFLALVESISEYVGAETAAGLGAAFGLSDGSRIPFLSYFVIAVS